MSGQELFHALSFVDERYIMEAETARFQKIPWMKYLSVAACLCILLVGAFALQNNKAAAPEAAPEAAAPPMAVPEAAPEAAPPAPESAAEEESLTGELMEVSDVRVRVVAVLEGVGLEAIVEADEPMEMDTAVTVVCDPSRVPGATEDVYSGLFLAVEAGDLLEISSGAYDPEQNILYVSHVLIVEE